MSSDKKDVDIVDVRLVLVISGEDRSISDVTEFFRTWKRDQPVWQNNTKIKFDLIDVRKRS